MSPTIADSKLVCARHEDPIYTGDGSSDLATAEWPQNTNKLSFLDHQIDVLKGWVCGVFIPRKGACSD